MKQREPWTPRMRRFVEEYLIDMRGGDAYLRAGYRVSPNVAKASAHKLLQKPHVQAALAERIAQRSQRTAVDADWVLARLARDATARVSDMFDSKGRILPIESWPDAWQEGLVVGVESFEEYQGTGKDRVAVGMVRKIKLSDRVKHLEMIGRHVNVGAFKPIELTGPNGGPIPIAALNVHLTPEEARAIAAKLAQDV